MSTPLVEIKNLKKYFPVGGRFFGHKQVVKAVDSVSFSIDAGETFGLVGESGCGKSTVARTIIRLYTPTDGEIMLDGKNIANLPENQLMDSRRKMQMIFQDPYASLDPRKNIEHIVTEPLTVHPICPKSEHHDRAAALLKKVGLSPDHLRKYPHEFSGGQRQRIGIARALITEPRFVLCDEPISALDVSIQAQVVNMLSDLQQEMGLTYLFIAHDLAMVKYISRRMGVMYLGQLVETAPSKELYENPLHPYTQGLLSSIPLSDPDMASKKSKPAMEGEIPSPMKPPAGCRFHTRCSQARSECREIAPMLQEVSPGHSVSCHLF